MPRDMREDLIDITKESRKGSVETPKLGGGQSVYSTQKDEIEEDWP